MARNSRECPFSLSLPLLRLLTPGSTFRPFGVSIVSSSTSSSSSSPAFQVSSFRLDASVRRTLCLLQCDAHLHANRYILNIVRFLEFVNARPFDVSGVRSRAFQLSEVYGILYGTRAGSGFRTKLIKLCDGLFYIAPIPIEL